MSNSIDPQQLAQEIQLCLNRTKLPMTHIACRTKIVENQGVYCVVTMVSPIDIEEDNRSFTVLVPLTNGATVMQLASELAEKFTAAINEDDHERASEDSKYLGLH